MSDTTDIPTTASRPPDSLRHQIVTAWEVRTEQLAEMREHRRKLNEAIKQAVAELKEQRKLVRVVAPELLNGDGGE